MSISTKGITEDIALFLENHFFSVTIDGGQVKASMDEAHFVLSGTHQSLEVAEDIAGVSGRVIFTDPSLALDYVMRRAAAAIAQ